MTKTDYTRDVKAGIQKYNKGDHVMVVNDLGSMMRHFENDCEAIVLYTYDEEYGGGNIDSYGIYIKGRGEVAWYYERQLNLIAKNRIDLLEQWEAEGKAENEMMSDLDWIFNHGDQVLETMHGASISALARCFGLMSLWGSSGEGIVYTTNANFTISLARRFLTSGDKDGWLKFCESAVDGNKKNGQ